MNPLAFTAIADLVKAVVSRVWPDPEKQAQAQLELAKLAQNGDLAQLQANLQLAYGQIEVNKVEAASESLFKSGWRPAIGWTCAGALFSQYILRPWVQWIAIIAGHPIPQLPGIDDQLWQLLGGMLGMGGLRTFEKVKGIA